MSTNDKTPPPEQEPATPIQEIEDALLAGEVDLAVHSAKDMPAVLVDGLAVAATLGRDDPRDAFVGPKSLGVYGHPNVGGSGVPDLCAIREAFNAGQQIGTGSIRRTAQLRSVFPKASFASVRGNVDTRLRKLDEGGYDALVLAAAGLRRLGFGGRITTVLPVEHCVPAPGQGIIAIETRADDRTTMRLLEPLNDARAKRTGCSRGSASATHSQAPVKRSLSGKNTSENKNSGVRNSVK